MFQGEAVENTRSGLRRSRRAVVVGIAIMAHDRQSGAEWAVSPEQIADARAYGKPGVEIAPGRMVTEPLPSDGAGRLPLKWILIGLAAGAALLAGTGRRAGGS